jgi:hypothetical protein
VKETLRNMKFLYLALFVLLVHLEYLSAADPLLLASAKKAVSRNPADYLSFDYYLNTCPDAEGIIQQIVGAWIQKDFTLAPSLIRLHFHDCAVRVRDSFYKIKSNSILISVYITPLFNLLNTTYKCKCFSKWPTPVVKYHLVLVPHGALGQRLDLF